MSFRDLPAMKTMDRRGPSRTFLLEAGLGDSVTDPIVRAGERSLLEYEKHWPFMRSRRPY